MRPIELRQRAVAGRSLRRRRSRPRCLVDRRPRAPSATAGQCGRSRSAGRWRWSSARARSGARALTTGPGARCRRVRTSIPAPAISLRAPSHVAPGGSLARSTRGPTGLVWTISPGAGRSDSTLITPATTASIPDRRSRSMCSSPLSSGTASRGAAWIRVSAASSPGLGRDQQVVRPARRALDRAGPVLKSPSAGCGPDPVGRDQLRGRLAGDDHHIGAAAGERSGDEAADPAGAEHGDVASWGQDGSGPRPALESCDAPSSLRSAACFLGSTALAFSVRLAPACRPQDLLGGYTGVAAAGTGLVDLSHAARACLSASSPACAPPRRPAPPRSPAALLALPGPAR